jgi:hypothetical protein
MTIANAKEQKASIWLAVTYADLKQAHEGKNGKEKAKLKYLLPLDSSRRVYRPLRKYRKAATSKENVAPEIHL